ncbi:MAG: competence/damage-inducible protein A [Dehalococcoidia bacterium]
MRAEILSIGTEIMLGEITDTNAAFIASKLPQFGIDLLYVTQVGDDRARLQEVIARAWQRSDLVFMTGGLGPTEDDLTRECIAAVLGEEMTVDAEQEAHLRQWFAQRTREFPERNLKQAMTIPSCRVLANPRGTAPGWWVERDGRVIVVMPGPPAEMTHMWEREVDPELERRATAVLVSRTLKTSGLGEGSVDERLGDLWKRTNPYLGIYARRDGVHVRISAKAPTREAAWALIVPVEQEVRRILGPAIWGVDDDSLAAGVGKLLRDRGLTLGVMESATGGAIADAMTDGEGSTEYFLGSLVTYATQTKIDLGVPGGVVFTHGVISEATAEAMARAARERLGANVGLGLTGIAGGAEMEGQPPGTMHIAVTDGNRTLYRQYSYYQGREAAKRRAVTESLNLLRSFLQAE